jgi:hypothetical protein
MQDFNNIFLTFHERFSLFAMRFIKRMPEKHIKNSFQALLRYGLISPNTDKLDSMGQNIPDGTYQLTDMAKRYRIHTRKQRFIRYLTPAIVAFITTIATNLLKELWLPVLLNWLSGLF